MRSPQASLMARAHEIVTSFTDLHVRLVSLTHRQRPRSDQIKPCLDPGGHKRADASRVLTTTDLRLEAPTRDRSAIRFALAPGRRLLGWTGGRTVITGTSARNAELAEVLLLNLAVMDRVRRAPTTISSAFPAATA